MVPYQTLVNTNRSGDLLFPAVVVIFGVPFTIGSVIAIVGEVVVVACVVQLFGLIAINVVTS